MSRNLYTTYSIFNDTEMPSDIVPCKTPCVPRGMLGMSWWKLNGFTTDCSCAYEVEFKKPLPPTDSIVCDDDETKSVESHDDLDDHGVMCHYSRTTGGWEPTEPYCVECGYGDDSCVCDNPYCVECCYRNDSCVCDEEDEPECSGKHCSNTENLRLEKCWDKFERAVTEQLVCERCYDELTKKDCVSCSEKYIWDELKIMPACFPWGRNDDCDEWKRTYCKACIIAIPESIQRNNLSEDDWL
jgi:hypothetical protein